MSARAIFIACVSVLGIALIAWFVSRFEHATVKEWVQPSGEARLRPFLAAERFATRMGLNATEVRAAAKMQSLPQADVLLMPNRRQDLDGGRISQILAWVDKGGHLIVEAELAGVPDPLLDRLGVKRESARAVFKPLQVQHDRRKLDVQLAAALKLEVPAKTLLAAWSAQDLKLATFERGAGIVTAAVSLEFARNRRIGDFDHAALLWELLDFGNARELLIYVRPERLSLWRFLIENAAPVLAAGAALLALWLWRTGPRFGPIAPDPAPARRRLLDHLRASGRFYWAKDLRGRLVEAARDAALRRVARAQPDFPSAPPAERAERLAALAGLSREAVHRFLTAAGELRGPDFVRFTQSAQRLHSALEKGKK
jgi:hypothetical protein